MLRTAVIMAGGSGERFWPLSRKQRPKQLLKLTDSGNLMIREAIDRIKPLISPEDIFIVTGEHLKKSIEEALPELPRENVIAEPAKRNTAPCLALAAGTLKNRTPEREISVAVLTADHIMKPQDKFIETVDGALNYVENNDVISTIGIKPSRPETGYGYIELGDKLDSNHLEISKVNQFKEKPDLKTAEKYYNSDNFLWNSGMFFFKVSTFVEEMEKNAPDIGKKIDQAYASNHDLKKVFSEFPNISIDYALMEKTNRAVVAKALFEWDDIGSFDSLDRVNDVDDNGNIIKGNVIALNCKNSIIINESDSIDTAYGLDGMILIKTNDASLTCSIKNAQNVKDVVEKLKEMNLEKYL